MRRLFLLVLVSLVVGCSTAATNTPTASPTTAPRLIAAPTPVPTATPTATVAPTISAAQCTGTEANRAALVDAAAKVSLAIYCAVLPADWSLKTLQGPVIAGFAGVNITYGTSGGLTLTVTECACSTEQLSLPTTASRISAGSFGDLPGDVYASTATYLMRAAPDKTRTYLIGGSSGVSSKQVMTWGAALAKVGLPIGATPSAS